MVSALIATNQGTFYPLTAQELSAGITPVNPYWPPYWNPRYGIVGDGSTDNTATMQAAHSTNVPINYLPGTYLFGSITMPGGGIVGAGIWQTFFITTDLSSSNAITANGGAGSGRVFSGFHATASGNKAGGYFVLLQPTSGSQMVQGARFTNTRIESLSSSSMNGVMFTQDYGFGMVGCEFSGLPTCVYISNTVNADFGDSSIVGGIISAAGGGTGIHYVSSGGLKITGAKMLGGAYGVLLDLSNTGTTSDLIISGSSIEAQTVAGIQLQRQAGATTTFRNVVINGNELLPPNGAYAMYTNDSSGFLSNLTFVGNAVSGNSGSQGVYVNHVTNSVIDCNIIQGGFVGGTTGVTLGANNVRAIYGKSNVVINFATPTVISTFVDPSQQKITSGGAGTVQSSTFNASVVLDGVATTFALTFPIAFIDKQTVSVLAATAVSVAFSVTGSGDGSTIKTVPATLSAGTGVAWQYDVSNTTWYRLY